MTTPDISDIETLEHAIGNAQTANIETVAIALADMKKILLKMQEYREAIRWCSGASDFLVDGRSRLGWLRIKHLMK